VIVGSMARIGIRLFVFGLIGDEIIPLDVDRSIGVVEFVVVGVSEFVHGSDP